MIHHNRDNHAKNRVEESYYETTIKEGVSRKWHQQL